jgi:hypothetical protein
MNIQQPFILNFVSIHTDFITAAQYYFKDTPNIKYTLASVATIPIENTAFIAPTDSFGNMSYGVSRIYNERLFPNIETQLKNKITQDSATTPPNISNIGKYLPVGKVVTIRTPKMLETNTSVICTPTVFLPGDVSQTTNAYDAFKAVLTQLSQCPPPTTSQTLTQTLALTLVCPALCTSTKANMSFEESARQIYQAYIDFINNIYKEYHI